MSYGTFSIFLQSSQLFIILGNKELNKILSLIFIKKT